MYSYLDKSFLAEYIMCTPNITDEMIMEKARDCGFEFRKNKGILDVYKAYKKAKDPKKGFGKIELELKIFETYLFNDVFKEDKVEKKMEFSKNMKYKVGDKVRIVKYPPKGSGFMITTDPLNSEMGKWLGKIMTIAQVQSRCYIMKEDNGKWAWTPSLIECKIV